jgi:hypothetical protein
VLRSDARAGRSAPYPTGRGATRPLPKDCAKEAGELPITPRPGAPGCAAPWVQGISLLISPSRAPIACLRRAKDLSTSGHSQVRRLAWPHYLVPPAAAPPGLDMPRWKVSHSQRDAWGPLPGVLHVRNEHQITNPPPWAAGPARACFEAHSLLEWTGYRAVSLGHHWVPLWQCPHDLHDGQSQLPKNRSSERLPRPRSLILCT